MEEIATDNRKKGFDNKLIFKHFPHYAKHVRDNYIVPYIKEQLTLARQVNMPLLDFFQSMSEDELVQMSIPSHSDFLTAVEENRLDELIETSISKWINDELEIVSRYDIKAEDITLGSYIRKKALSKFITSYTNDPEEIIALLGEIDTYSTKSDTASTNAYITILQDKIHDQLHMIEKISNTTPGLNYVYNLEQGQLTFANKNYEQFVGHTANELKELGAQVLGKLIYPDDLAHSVNVLAAFNTVKDGDVISWDLRMKNNGGEYTWMRNYTSVFRRKDNGEPVEIIGIMLDINNQKKISEQLVEREAELLNAQQQANMASYEWDQETDEIIATPNLLKIFEVAEGFKRDELVQNVHPDDRNLVNAAWQNAVDNATSFDCEYRYLINGKEKSIWSKGALVEKNGRKVLRGTVMDITEKQTLINRLQHSDTLFKQAQDLAQIGNWSLDFKTNQLEWSDTLYHIYGLNKYEDSIDYQTVASYNHPDDAVMVSQVMQLSRENLQPFDFFYRIVLPTGNIKILHAKGDVIKDKNGNAYKMHGTLQDVTRQKESENQLRNYQEFIQKITNVTPSIITTYNVRTGVYSFVNEAVEKLLGYTPQEVMSKGFPFMLSLIHPDDVDALLEKNSFA
ncbi:MAG: PAS domain-containing protein, partial [Flavipsychrobacter sp.]